MEKIKHCINHNRFIPIDTEELTALELIGKTVEKTNEVIDGLEQKTDFVGDHMGTWHGLKPSQANESIGSLVDQLNDEVGNIKIENTKFNNVLTSLSYYNADKTGTKDCSTILQTALNSTEGILYIESGIYKISSLINLENKNITIIGSGNVTLKFENSLEQYFSFRNCNLRIENITFDMNNQALGLISCFKTPTIIKECTFKNSIVKYDGLNHNVITLTYCVDTAITNNRFFNIGSGITGSVNQPQYRCIGANAGCNNLLISDNNFKQVHQVLVSGDWDIWKTGKTFNVNDIIYYKNGDIYTSHKCILQHTSNEQILPTNTQYWTFLEHNVYPNESIIFANNICDNIGDNAIYYLNYNRFILIKDNTFLNNPDEPIVLSGQGCHVLGNRFINTRNKAIAIANYNDIDSVIIRDNYFKNEGDYYIGQFIVSRDPKTTYTLWNVEIENNTILSPNNTSSNVYVWLQNMDTFKFKNNHIKGLTNSYQVMLRTGGMVANGIIENNTFIGNASDSVAFQSDVDTNYVKFNDNIIKNCRANLKYNGMVRQGQIVQFSGSNIYGLNNTKNILYSGSLPSGTTCDWTVGDIIFHNAPTAGGNIGWVCTTGGTTPTWKTFGTIQA